MSSRKSLKSRENLPNQRLKNVRNFIFPFLIFFLSLESFSLELLTEKFMICQQKRATGIHFRTLRIHKVSQGEKSKYIAIYSRQGQDDVIAQANWLVFCEKIVNQVKNNLEKYLWSCKEQKPIKVFYSNKTVQIP